MTVSLVWYRQDLRVIDHEPLREATKAGPTIGLVCVDPAVTAKSRFGFERTGSHRLRFLLDSIADLRLQWEQLGGRLLVRHMQPDQAIDLLIGSLGVSNVFTHQQVGSEEKAEQDRVAKVCRDQNISFSTYHGATLLHPGDLPFDVSETPELFTKFRKIVEKQSHPRPAFPAPVSIASPELSDVALGEIPTLEELGRSEPARDPRQLVDYRGGQSAGLSRLRDYVWDRDRLRVYKQTRNGMLHVDDSSKFSPWLAHGCVSARMIADAVSQYEEERGANESTYWMIFELLWRDYFHFIMAKHGRSLFLRGGLRGLSVPWRADQLRFESWRDGKTGYPLVDANMRELAATGYMSNRGRQNVASFLTKNLGLDWRMGAAWFESRLIDYDVASNYGNWNYAAGVGNDARGFRFFNITKQARDYDRQGDYVRHWLPELQSVSSDRIHEPWRMTSAEQDAASCRIGEDYPEPIVDLSASAKENEVAYQNAAAKI